MEAAKVVKGKEVLESADVCAVLEAMMNGIMHRGKTKAGDKTMLDTLYPVVNCYKECLANGTDDATTVQLVKAAAKAGSESTKEMEAVRGRAYYQANKGVGHLDPGSVTMYYQIDTLMDYIATKL